MSRKSQPKKVQLWTDRLSRFVKSEQTVRQFCRAEGTSLPSFYQWKKKLATSDDSVAAGDSAASNHRLPKTNAFKIGRKNWLFCGSVAGGERNAGFMTLVSSAHRNDLDVWAYVHDILKRLLAGETDYEPMLPWNWGAAHPASIREFRQKERRERTEEKQFQRDRRRA